MADEEPSFGPLAGLKVIDIATIIAAPMAASLLADFGAEVIKIEMPGSGDLMRGFPPYKEGKPLWWKVTNRGKRHATLDLRNAKGAELFKRLVARHDVLIENFRPGTLEKWGLGPEVLWQLNPRLVILRVSAFGQTGPYSQRRGFARLFESMGGMTHLNGYEDRPPIHNAYPVPDAIGGLFGAFSILAALHGIDRNRLAGEQIDLALTEGVFRILENIAIEYDQLGFVRGRTGNTNQYAWSNVFRTRDGRYISISGSTESTFRANAAAIGRPELADDPRLSNNVLRLQHFDELDEAFSEFIGAHDLDQVVAAFEANNGVAAPVYSIDQIAADPQLRGREAIVAVEDEDFGTVRMQGVVPKFQNRPGKIRWAARGVGADNDTVWRKELQLDDSEIAALRAEGII